MKFGCYCAPEQIETVAGIGYDYVELSAAVITRLSQRDFAALQTRLERCRIPCLVAADYCGDWPVIAGSGFDAREATQYAKAVCERTYALGIRCLGVGSPLARTLPVKYAYYRAQAQAAEFFRVTAEAALPYEGLNILVEALNFNSCNFCNTQQQAGDLIRLIDMPNVFMEVDFFHMLMMAEPFARVADYSTLAKHSHISGRTAEDLRRFFTEEDRPICRDAVAALRQCGYTGTLSMEVPLDAFSAEGAARSLDMLREAMG